MLINYGIIIIWNVGDTMESFNLILSIIASIISILSAVASFNYYKKTLKITSSYSNNAQISGDNSQQIVGNKNKVK